MTGRSPNTVLRPSEFWALQDISFDLERGSSIGIVGSERQWKNHAFADHRRNSAADEGRSSPAGSDRADAGARSRLQAVVVGSREYLSQHVHSRGDRSRRSNGATNSVVDFAELHSAIEAPLGTYSTGMQMRLGFACAVHTSPEILIVDEVLAVGDAPFRMKCRNRINELRKGGTSMLLVSHSAVTIETLTDQCLYLKAGQEVALGPSDQVIKTYEADAVKVAQIGNSKITAGALAKGNPVQGAVKGKDNYRRSARYGRRSVTRVIGGAESRPSYDILHTAIQGKRPQYRVYIYRY